MKYLVEVHLNNNAEPTIIAENLFHWEAVELAGRMGEGAVVRRDWLHERFFAPGLANW